jgi:dolichyl-phosphate-mannose-protein mannosyltransferase
MKRSDSISLNFGTPEVSPRTSSEFEEIHYPHYNTTTTAAHGSGWPVPPREQEELPLHYMGEETARRRVRVTPGGNGVYDTHAEAQEEYDDEGKDVYTKMRASKVPVSSGRPRRPPPPPATTIVRILFQFITSSPS